MDIRSTGVLVAEAQERSCTSITYRSPWDRSSRDFDVLATANGGTEVEEIAKEHPEAVKRLHITSLEDFDIEAARRMANAIGFYHADEEQCRADPAQDVALLQAERRHVGGDLPVGQDRDPDDEASKSLCALDAKISLDGNAAFRHDGWRRFEDPVHEDPFERQANEHGLHYVHLHGEVGVIGNGAGLVMSSLDAVSEPARIRAPASSRPISSISAAAPRPRS